MYVPVCPKRHAVLRAFQTGGYVLQLLFSFDFLIPNHRTNAPSRPLCSAPRRLHSLHLVFLLLLRLSALFSSPLLQLDPFL